MTDLSSSPLGWSSLYALTCFSTFVLAFLLAAFILWKNPKSPTAHWWAVMCLFVAGWAFWNTVSLLSPTPFVAFALMALAWPLFIQSFNLTAAPSAPIPNPAAAPPSP